MGQLRSGESRFDSSWDSADTFNGTLEQMQNSTGATETAFGKLNTNSFTIQKAFNQLKNSAIEFGTAIMSVLAPILMALAEKIQAFTAWGSWRILVQGRHTFAEELYHGLPDEKAGAE